MTCTTCHTEVPDDDLFCPRCGAATVPQLSKQELSDLMWRQSRPREPLRYGLLALLIVPALYAGGILLGLLSLDDLNNGRRVSAVLMAWGLLGGCGALIGHLVAARRRPKPK
jgi:hypothetical protein